MFFREQIKKKAITFSYDDGVVQDIRLIELHILRLTLGKQSLIVVVDRNRHISLSRILTDNILVKKALDAVWSHKILLAKWTELRVATLRLFTLLGYYIVLNKELVAVLDARCADRGAIGAVEHKCYLVGWSATEGAVCAAVLATFT